MMVRGGDRLGIYFAEKGASQRPSKVIYDRANSAIAKASRSDFDWDEILNGADWFHFTGITPALGGELPQICLDACKKAKELGVKVSCDLNYRKKLWTREEANRVMTQLMSYVDVCISNEEDASDVFGIVADNTDINTGKIDRDGYISVATKLQERFGFEKVAITLRGSISASDNDWAGMLYSDGKACFSHNYRVHIVDRVGGGDSFASGLIYGLMTTENAEMAVNYGAAHGALAMTTPGDTTMASKKEVEAIMGGAGARVQR